LLCVACSKGDGGKASTSAGIAATSSGSGSPAAETVEPANTAVDVSGAYLVGCSPATEYTYVQSNQANHNLTACILETKLGEGDYARDVESISVEVATPAGPYKPELVTKQEANAPWHIGFRMPPGLTSMASDIKITYKLADHAATTVSVADDNFDWRSDPSFQDILLTTRGLITVFSFNEDVTFDKSDGIRPWLASKQTDGIFIAFPTDELYPATFGGIEQADKICTDAAQAIRPGLTAQAILSTSKSNARDRIKTQGRPIMNFRGDLVTNSDDPLHDLFARPSLGTKMRFSQTGHSASGYVLADPTYKTFNEWAWTGTNPDGTVSDVGTCGDWTSADARINGEAGDANVADDGEWVAYRKAGLFACSEKARLLCITEYK
jgi:hypothetical protein